MLFVVTLTYFWVVRKIKVPVELRNVVRQPYKTDPKSLIQGTAHLLLL